MRSHNIKVGEIGQAATEFCKDKKKSWESNYGLIFRSYAQILGFSHALACLGFRKRSSNWRNLKTPAFCFGVDEKLFENEDINYDSNDISRTECYSNTN